MEEKDLEELLYGLMKEEPRVVILEFLDIGVFTLGIGLPYGFAQFSKSGEPPYLIARSDIINSGRSSSDEIEFDSGGTSTPIPKDYCLPYRQVIDIVLYFFRNYELPSFIEWAEI